MEKVEQWVMGVVGSALLALSGWVLRMSSKVSKHEAKIEALERMREENREDHRRFFDKLEEGVAHTDAVKTDVAVILSKLDAVIRNNGRVVKKEEENE